MKTITFYSYKGGVGRTLALSNVAKRLSEFGKKVCVLDFDLEAPGLHLKFKDQLNKTPIKEGLVDYIHRFIKTNKAPGSIKKMVYKIDFGSKNYVPIDFIPAGNIYNSEYWKKLSGINWGDLFYKKDSEGVAFFIDLKEKIRKELNPEFLIIDTRTGITEISAISINLFSDEVVILAANNDENIIGAQQIIRSISKKENNIMGVAPKIHFVLSRIPYSEKPSDRRKEEILIKNIKHRINTNLSSKECSYIINDINVIHSDRKLEIEESLKIGYSINKNTISASNDYLNLFYKLFGNDLSPDVIKKINNLLASKS